MLDCSGKEGECCLQTLQLAASEDCQNGSCGLPARLLLNIKWNQKMHVLVFYDFPFPCPTLPPPSASLWYYVGCQKFWSHGSGFLERQSRSTGLSFWEFCICIQYPWEFETSLNSHVNLTWDCLLLAMYFLRSFDWVPGLCSLVWSLKRSLPAYICMYL